MHLTGNSLAHVEVGLVREASFDKFFKRANSGQVSHNKNCTSSYILIRIFIAQMLFQQTELLESIL